MDQYGHLAEPELMRKYIEFLKNCHFAGIEDMKYQESYKGKLPENLKDNLILELVRQGKAPLMWDADSLEQALKIEKEMTVILQKAYEKAWVEYKEN
jgi:hypothetical protein